MNRKHNYHSIFSIFGLVVVLGMALGADALMAFINHNWWTFPLELSFFWAFILPALLSLLLAAASLTLFRFLFNQAPRDVWIALIFILTGLLFVAYPVLYFIPNLLPALPPQLDNLLSNPRSYSVYSGGFITMMGLFALVFPRGRDL